MPEQKAKPPTLAYLLGEDESSSAAAQPAPRPKRSHKRKAKPAALTAASEPAPALPAKRPRGRPRTAQAGGTPPESYEDALTLCKPDEQSFVRFVVAGATYREAYAKLNPQAERGACAQKGSQLAQHAAVRLAIDLGRRETARAVAIATKHDVQAAFTELGEIMNEARTSEQYTAAVKAAETRAKLTGALVDRVESRQAGGFIFRIEGLPNEARTIEVRPEPAPAPEEKENPDG